MISSAWRLYRSVMVVVDAASVAATYVLADVLRCRLKEGVAWPEQIAGLHNTVPVHFWVLAVLPLIWPVMLAWHGWYEPRWRSWWWLVQRIVSATAILSLSVAALALLFQRELYPRSQIGFMAVLLPATTLLVRGISGLIGQWAGSRQPRHVLIVGTGREAVRLRRLMRSVAMGKPTVIGHLRLPEEAASERACTGAILGGIDELPALLDRHGVDEVLFAVRVEDMHRVLPHIALCEEVGVTAAIMADSMVCHTTPAVVDYYGIPLMSYRPARQHPELLLVKRLIDVGFAVLGLLVCWPLMALAALLVKLFSPGPVLFRQVRSGLSCRPFEMLKFRTMDVDAESRRAEIEHLNETDGPVFKSSRDPRITKIGAWLRRFSIDELPQLWNVLRGDMSVVGPRPPLPDEVEKYDRWQRRRLSMRPGLTCLWQIKGRHRIGFEEWMQLDLFYIDHWSLKLDFLIVFKTIVTVVSGSGA